MNARPGRSLAVTGQTLDIVGQHLWVRLPLAQLAGASLAFDAAHGRLGELTFLAERALVGETEALASLTEGMP